MSSMAFLHSP
uniref:Uncharacterized protein n=1 Tax=Anguilla anguilla TaxID=7936 RepID=A0A0E9R1U7_ANGAN